MAMALFLLLLRLRLGAHPMHAPLLLHMSAPSNQRQPLEPSRRLPRRLTGSFMPDKEKLENGFDYDDIAFGDIDDDVELDSFWDDGSPSGETTQEWSRRSTAKRNFWAHPERREAMLAKRRATIASKREQQPPTVPLPAKPPRSPAVAKRAASLSQRFTDEESWMNRRLADGADWRARLNNDEYKKERQRKRSEVARLRSEKVRKAQSLSQAIEKNP